VRRVRSSSSSDCMRRTPRLADDSGGEVGHHLGDAPPGIVFGVEPREFLVEGVVGERPHHFGQQLVTGTDPAMQGDAAHS